MCKFFMAGTCQKGGMVMIAHALALHSIAYMIRLPFVSLLCSICFNVLPFAAGIHCNFAHSQEQIGEETRRYFYLFLQKSTFFLNFPAVSLSGGVATSYS